MPGGRGGAAPPWSGLPWRRSVEARRSPSNSPSLIMRSFCATSGGGGGGLSSPGKTRQSSQMKESSQRQINKGVGGLLRMDSCMHMDKQTVNDDEGVSQ